MRLLHRDVPRQDYRHQANRLKDHVPMRAGKLAMSTVVPNNNAHFASTDRNGARHS